MTQYSGIGINQLRQKSVATLKTSSLLVIAFAIAFFPRIIDTLGAPSVINYVHLLIVPAACIFALCTTKVRNPQQLTIVKELLVGLSGLLIIGFMSALLNGAGIINVIFDFVLSAESFIFLLAWISVPLTQISLGFVWKWFVRFNLFNLILAISHGFTISVGDNMQGVFYKSGSGHVVASSVIITFSLYYFFFAKQSPAGIRLLVLIGGFFHLILADAKQVMLILLIGFVLLAISNMKNVGKAILLLLLGIGFIAAFYWAVYTYPILGAFKAWIRPEIYLPGGEANELKTAGIRIIIEHYESFLNWFLGLGPGQTIDRLGFTILKEHGYILEPLGATTSSVSAEVSAAREASWLGDASSFFSPFWGWAAIWGDLGILGLGAYLYLCMVTWCRICFDDFSKFVVLTVMLHGLIFTQLEEPGYMLFIAMLLSLHWHKNRFSAQTKNLISLPKNEYMKVS